MSNRSGASARLSSTSLTIGRQHIAINVKDDTTSIQEIVERRKNIQDMEVNNLVPHKYHLDFLLCRCMHA